MSVWRSPYPVLGIVIAMAIGCPSYLLWNEARQTVARQQQAAERFALEHSLLLARTVAPYLHAADAAGLSELLGELRAGTAVTGVSVYDLSGRLVAALTPEQRPPGLLPAGRPAETRAAETRAAGAGAAESDDDGNGSSMAALRRVAGGVGVERPVMLAGGLLGLVQASYPGGPAHWTAALNTVNLTVAGGGLALLAALLTLLLYPMRRSVRDLQRAIERLRAGDWDSEVTAAGPAAVLGEQLNAFLGEEKQRRGKLRRQGEQARQELHRLNLLLRDSQTIVWEADSATGQFSYISEAAEGALGHPLSTWLSAGFIDTYIHPNDRDWLCDYFAKPGSDSASFSIDLRVRNAAGDWRWLQMLGTVEMRGQGPAPVGLLRDVTGEKLGEQQIAHLRDHDAPTGLLNRGRWHERGNELLGSGRAGDGSVALLQIDIARFQLVNELFGPDVADEYLVQAAQALSGLLRPGELLGRLGSDEFGLLVPGADGEGARRRSAELLESLDGREFATGQHRVPLAANIGMALYPDHGFKMSDLMAKAGSALLKAKRSGPGADYLFDDSDNAQQSQTLVWAARLHQSLEADRLKMLFQPLIDMRSGKIRCYDTLLWWKEGSEEMPSSYGSEAWHTAAELFGLNTAIDRWMVVNALRQQHTIIDPGNEPRLLLSLTSRYLGGQEILTLLRETSRLYKLSPDLLTVALDAQVVKADLPGARSFARALRESGQRFAIDRFGVGGLMLTDLQDLPVDLIRFDEKLIDRLDWSQTNQTFVKATVDVARTLNVPVAAPGVDDQERFRLLRDLGVRFGQGRFFAMPEPRFHELGRVVIAASA